MSSRSGGGPEAAAGFAADVYDLIDGFLAHRDPSNPYESGGVSYAPRVLARAMDTPADVAARVAEGEAVYRLTDDEVVARSGVEAAEARRVIETGEGRASDVLAVLRAAGVCPVAVPMPRAEGGEGL